MPTDANGRWYPRLSQKQVEVFNDTRIYQLLSGPRACGKTIVALHKIIKHAWLYPNDRVGIFVKSIKVGKTGVWDDLINYALPEWAGDNWDKEKYECAEDDPEYDPGLKNEGFRVTVPSSVDGATRMHYVRISNRYGGESEIQLHTLHHDDDVKEKLRGTRFGAMMWDELDNYDEADVFNVAILQLRQIGLPHNKHLWIGTCNPAGDESHWIYQKFWVDPRNEDTDKEYAQQIATHEFKLLDNPYLDRRVIITLKETYKNNPEEYQRYVEGKWVGDLKNAHFAGAFSPNFHVRGDIAKGEIILPSDNCQEIKVGYDLGDRNHSVSFMEKVTTTSGEYWTTLDEIVHIGEDVSLEELTYEVMEKMDELEDLAGHKLHFKHWSDRSAFDRYRSAADARDHILINRYSGGRIELIGCPKSPQSVRARVNLVRQMFLANKLFISIVCPRHIEMCKKLSKGKNKADFVRRDSRGHIHVFDSMSYILYGENIDEIEMGEKPKLGVKPFSVAS